MMAKIILSNETINEIKTLFCEGICIPILMKKYGLGRNKITKTLKDSLQNEYKFYAKKVQLLVLKNSIPKRCGKKQNRTPEWSAKIGLAQRGKKLSKETKEKIGLAVKTRIERGTWTKEQQKIAIEKTITKKRNNGYFEIHSKRHSEWMKQNATNRGTKMSPESCKKMSEVKRKFYDNGGISPNKGRIVSLKERKKRSEIASKMWKEGKFSYGNEKVMRSKLEKSVYEQIIQTFSDAKHSFRLTDHNKTYVFDIFIPSINTLIEVNGDYWHYNPKLYEATHFDKYRNKTAKDVWDKDIEKLNFANSLGYKTITLWEDEIKQFCDIKNDIKNKIINI